MYKISGFEPDTKLSGCLFKDNMVLWGPSSGKHNGADAKTLSDMEIQTRRAVFDHFEALKKERPDLKNAHIVDTGVLLGIRQTRFTKGFTP